MPLDGLRVSPLINHGINENNSSRHSVIDGEGENSGKQSVETEKFTMLAVGHKQRVDVRAYRVQEIEANARFLPLVEQASIEKILFGLGKDYDVHALRFANSCFTRPQSS